MSVPNRNSQPSQQNAHRKVQNANAAIVSAKPPELPSPAAPSPRERNKPTGLTTRFTATARAARAIPAVPICSVMNQVVRVGGGRAFAESRRREQEPASGPMCFVSGVPNVIAPCTFHNEGSRNPASPKWHSGGVLVFRPAERCISIRV